MLKKYELFLQGSEKNILDFIEALREMDKNYYVCKEEFNLHKGCRKNWFPLVLVNKCFKGHQRKGNTSLEVRVQIHNFVDKLASCNYYHSFYIEKFGKMTSEKDNMRSKKYLKQGKKVSRIPKRSQKDTSRKGILS